MELMQIYEIMPPTDDTDLDDMVDKDGYNITQETAPRTIESKLKSLKRRAATASKEGDRMLINELIRDLETSLGTDKPKPKYFDVDSKPETKDKTVGSYFTVPGEK